MICAFDEPFDIVMNSLAFTFIAEVGSVFNEPLVNRMANILIKDLPEGYGEIKYLYPEQLVLRRRSKNAWEHGFRRRNSSDRGLLFESRPASQCPLRGICSPTP